MLLLLAVSDLFADVFIGRHQKADEYGYSTSINHIASVLRCARCDIRQCPSSFELQRLDLFVRII